MNEKRLIKGEYKMGIIYKTIQNEQGDETFEGSMVTWNISKISDWLKGSKKHLYKLSKHQYQNLICEGQKVNKNKIDEVDLEVPIIVAINYDDSHILIDGIHRVRKAKKNDEPYILAYILPFEEHIKFLECRAYFNSMINAKNTLELETK